MRAAIIAGAVAMAWISALGDPVLVALGLWKHDGVGALGFFERWFIAVGFLLLWNQTTPAAPTSTLEGET